MYQPRQPIPIVPDPTEEPFLARLRRLERERRDQSPRWLERARAGNGLGKDLTGRGAA